MKPEVVAPFHKREGTGGGMDVLSHQVFVVQRHVAMPGADDAEEHQQYAGDDERQAEASHDIIEGKGYYGNQAACHGLPAFAVYLAIINPFLNNSSPKLISVLVSTFLLL